MFEMLYTFPEFFCTCFVDRENFDIIIINDPECVIHRTQDDLLRILNGDEE